MKEQAAILLDPKYPKLVSCLFDALKKKNSKEPTRKYKTWQESDRELWRKRYDAIGKDFFFPDWVLRLLQKIPTIQPLPSEEAFARSNSTQLSDSIFFPGLDQRNETQLTSDEKLLGLALFFGVLDPERDCLENKGCSVLG